MRLLALCVLAIASTNSVACSVAPDDTSSSYDAVSVSPATCLPEFRARGERLDRTVQALLPRLDALGGGYGDVAKMIRTQMRPRMARVQAIARIDLAPPKPYAPYFNLCADARKVSADQVNPAYYEVKNTINALIARDLSTGQGARGLAVRELWNPADAAKDSVFKAYQGGGNDYSTLVNGLVPGDAGPLTFGDLSTPATSDTHADNAPAGCLVELRRRVDEAWTSLDALESTVRDRNSDGVYAETLQHTAEVRKALATVGAIASMNVAAPWSIYVNACFDAKDAFDSGVAPAYAGLRDRLDQTIAVDIALRHSDRAGAIQAAFRTAPGALFRALDGDGAPAATLGWVGSLEPGSAPVVRFSR